MMCLLFLLALPVLPEDDLKTLESDLLEQESQRSQLLEQVSKIDSRISELRKRIFEEKMKTTPFVSTVTRLSGNLYETTNVFTGPKVLSFKGATPVRILGFDPAAEVYNGSIGDSVGFLMQIDLMETPELLALKQRMIDERRKSIQAMRDREQAREQAQEASAQRKRTANRAAKAQEREARLVRQYGADLGRRLFVGEIFLGMTKEMALESRGRPEAINRTVTAGLVYEQWVYGRQYLYFHNGVMTSFQD